MVEAVAGFWGRGLKPKLRIFEFNEYLNRLFDRKSRGDPIFVVSSNELMDADKSSRPITRPAAPDPQQ
jgi:peptide/nickel transport system substrate-binding protein